MYGYFRQNNSMTPTENFSTTGLQEATSIQLMIQIVDS